MRVAGLFLSHRGIMIESLRDEVIHMPEIETATTADRIIRARNTAGVGQRQLARMVGLPQTTLQRIEKSTRPAKMNEILLIASALGCGVPELTGHSDIRGRVECAARATDGSSMASMRAELVHYLELDAYLDDQGIARST